jgi:hypothetical protein
MLTGANSMKTKLRVNISIVVVFFLVSSFWGIRICSAEQNSTTSYLINEKASMLDFGMYTLRNHLRGHVDALYPGLDLGVSYYPDSNKIDIYTGNSDTEKFKTEQEVKDWCKEIICSIRMKLAIDCSSLKSYLPTGSSWAYLFFSHNGYSPDNQPKNLGTELDKIIKISVGSPLYTKNMSGYKFIKCEVPLLGSDILCSELK